ncbi:MAG: hypothetical protein B7Y99_03170 [Caulobacterales bacterium 32-69-10]|nr:MAG: hypothetical protein B7Y99_03170 [Caulobacterales bacterium 32-69-10]
MVGPDIPGVRHAKLEPPRAEGRAGFLQAGPLNLGPDRAQEDLAVEHVDLGRGLGIIGIDRPPLEDTAHIALDESGGGAAKRVGGRRSGGFLHAEALGPAQQAAAKAGHRLHREILARRLRQGGRNLQAKAAASVALARAFEVPSRQVGEALGDDAALVPRDDQHPAIGSSTVERPADGFIGDDTVQVALNLWGEEPPHQVGRTRGQTRPGA